VCSVVQGPIIRVYRLCYAPIIIRGSIVQRLLLLECSVVPRPILLECSVTAMSLIIRVKMYKEAPIIIRGVMYKGSYYYYSVAQLCSITQSVCSK
jgi:hypothetical protein